MTVTTAASGTAREMEGRGLDYERYSINRLFRRLLARHAIDSVLELPAKGEKAMPSFYSIAFAEAGRRVTMVNAEPRSDWAWQELGLSAERAEAADITHTGLPGAGWDLVWNFMILPQCPDPHALLAEMTRLSRRYVMYMGVNRFNPGFFSHRMVHRISGVPWTHGAVEWMNPFWVCRFLRERGLTIVERGCANCPPYPDSLGFRDMRLHRKGVDLTKIDWDCRTVGWMKNDRYPPRMKLYMAIERLPLPFLLKLIYAHLFYVIAEKPAEPGGH